MKIVRLAVLTAGFLATTSAWANHPVLLEGNCLVPPPGSGSSGPPQACGDYDGDGRIGRAEDNDGDRVFGTIFGALGPSGVNMNGAITIVTSGVFSEIVRITAQNGNVTLQAAPGVEADIDAVLQGDAPGSAARQNEPGIVVNAPDNRRITFRNLTIRNWTIGIQVNGASVVTIEDCRIENNTDYGILAKDSSKVKVDKTSVLSTGYRVNPTSNFPSSENNPRPGSGIAFIENSSGAVFRTEVSGSFRAGIIDRSGGSVRTRDVYLFNNRPDSDGEITEE